MTRSSPHYGHPAAAKWPLLLGVALIVGIAAVALPFLVHAAL